MKTISKLMAMAALALCTLSLMTSCDEDREEARILSGQWYGDFGMYYSDGYDTWYATTTDIRFIPNNGYSRRGTGEEVDYFNRPCPIRYQSFFFYWEIRDGVIYLDYPHNPDLNVAIYDYRLDYDYFSGYFGDSHEWFRLVKLSGYNDWNLYDPYNYYGYGSYDPYYYSKSRDGVEKPDQQPTPDPSTFRFGRDLRRNKTE